MSRYTWAYDYDNPVELNRYTYARQNPVRYRDPSDYSTFAERAIIIGTVGTGTLLFLLANQKYQEDVGSNSRKYVDKWDFGKPFDRVVNSLIIASTVGTVEAAKLGVDFQLGIDAAQNLVNINFGFSGDPGIVAYREEYPDVQQTLEDFLEIFPNIQESWQQYIESVPASQQSWQEFLEIYPSVQDVWQNYIETLPEMQQDWLDYLLFYQHQRTEQELNDLARDPDHAHNITPKSTLEARGEIPGLITRDPTGAGEFIDGNGVTWDIKGFYSGQGKGSFALPTALAQIEEEIFLYNENIIVDTSKMTRVDVQVLENAINIRGWSSHVRW